MVRKAIETNIETVEDFESVVQQSKVGRILTKFFPPIEREDPTLDAVATEAASVGVEAATVDGGASNEDYEALEARVSEGVTDRVRRTVGPLSGLSQEYRATLDVERMARRIGGITATVVREEAGRLGIDVDVADVPDAVATAVEGILEDRLVGDDVEE